MKDPPLQGRQKKKTVPIFCSSETFLRKIQAEKVAYCCFKAEINQNNFETRKGLEPFPCNIIGLELVECMKGKK